MLAEFFTKSRKKFVASKLGDIGTALIIAFVIGELLSDKAFNYYKFILSLIVAIVFYSFATIATPKN